jgi:hypothetical protein
MAEMQNDPRAQLKPPELSNVLRNLRRVAKRATQHQSHSKPQLGALQIQQRYSELLLTMGIADTAALTTLLTPEAVACTSDAVRSAVAIEAPAAIAQPIVGRARDPVQRTVYREEMDDEEIDEDILRLMEEPCAVSN